jgi:uncharacterized DUF497 family protein
LKANSLSFCAVIRIISVRRSTAAEIETYEKIAG